MFVLIAGREHPAGWKVMRASHHFAKEAELSGDNHAHDTWDVIKHLAIFFIKDVVFLDLHEGDVEYPPDATIKENLKSLEKILSKRPVFAYPKKKIHRDCPKEKVFAVCV